MTTGKNKLRKWILHGGSSWSLLRPLPCIDLQDSIFCRISQWVKVTGSFLPSMRYSLWLALLVNHSGNRWHSNFKDHVWCWQGSSKFAYCPARYTIKVLKILDRKYYNPLVTFNFMSFHVMMVKPWSALLTFVAACAHRLLLQSHISVTPQYCIHSLTQGCTIFWKFHIHCASRQWTDGEVLKSDLGILGKLVPRTEALCFFSK